MQKRALGGLVLSALFGVALCGWTIYIPDPKTWSEAREFCRENYTDLSSIGNHREDTIFQVHVSQGSRFWIGLHRNDRGEWEWSGGEDASFFNWAQGEEGQDHGCVAHSDAGWRNDDCSKRRPFSCFHNGLVLVKENKTWEEAMERCRQQHRDLVSVTSESVLLETLRTSRWAQAARVWTGLRFLAGGWLWVSGETVSYQAWSPGETPQCPAWIRRCGALSLEGRRWESWDCADTLNFVCNIE
uniref:macrophage mannose receptor 1-like n=1 Tax=Gasterosteus aculeatus aculeatus TaxID=481459 RepID=UPI001A984DAD|nr:macrophage mannose receptor 1-like [Gasterosteus aculeatus aculeatus]